jgi:hypothetical protein
MAKRYGSKHDGTDHSPLSLNDAATANRVNLSTSVDPKVAFLSELGSELEFAEDDE